MFKEKQMSCCSKLESSHGCTSHVKYYKLNESYAPVAKTQLSFAPLFIALVTPGFSFNDVSNDVIPAFNDSGPPFSLGLTALSMLSVFRL
jgi:hypothetical protein